jgi:hypothetical protein
MLQKLPDNLLIPKNDFDILGETEVPHLNVLGINYSTPRQELVKHLGANMCV